MLHNGVFGCHGNTCYVIGPINGCIRLACSEHNKVTSFSYANSADLNEIVYARSID